MKNQNETGGGLLSVEGLKRKVVGCGDWLGNHAALECAFLLFMGIAIVGETGGYSLALGVLLPCYWLRTKAKRIRQLERCVEINRDFWEAASSTKDSGLIATMREMHRASLPNSVIERNSWVPV